MRLKQIAVIGMELGVLRVIFLISIILIAISGFANTGYAIVFFAVVVFSIHLSRRDKKLVMIISPNCYYVVFLAEYLFISVPLLVVLVYTFKLSAVALFLIMLLLITLVRSFEILNFFTVNINFLVPDKNFEWKSGLRKYGLQFLLLYTAALVCAPFKYVPILILWGTLLVILRFYEHFEDYKLLEIENVSVAKFLKKKIGTAVSTFHLYATPVLALHLVLNTEVVWAVIAFYGLSMIFLGYVVLTKYAFYVPFGNSIGNKIIGYVGVFSVLLPFFIPLPLIMAVRYYAIAKSNLKTYIHD